MLATELEDLVSHLRALMRPVVDLMRPGVGSDVLSSYTGNSEIPASVSEWFAWCNGVESRPGQLQDDVNIIPGYSPLAIQEASQLRASYEGDPILGERFLPLLSTGGADIYVAVWEGSDEARVAGVLTGESTEIEFDSIEQMVSVFNACFTSGAFFVGEGGRFDMDPDLYESTYAGVVGNG